MNGNRIFIDTNVIIYILSGDKSYIETVIGKKIFVSFISELEVLSYKFENIYDELKAKEFFNKVDIVNINEDIKQLVIGIKKKYKIRLPDCIILATSLYANAELKTNDLKLLKIYNKLLLE